MTSTASRTRPRARSIPRFTLFLAALTLFSVAGCRRMRWRWHRHAAIAMRPHFSPARVASGRTIYLRYCAICHRADGSGYGADHAPAIANQDYLQVASDAFLRDSIRDGHPGTPMSAWGRVHGGPLDDAMIADVVTYLRSLSTRRFVNVNTMRVAAGSVDNGRTVWMQRCMSCHGFRGEGSPTATSVSHPNFERTASNGFIRWTIEHGRRGTQMASFASLGPHVLDDLVAYIRTLEHTPTPVAMPVYEPPPSLDHLILNPEGRTPEFTLRDGLYVPAADVLRAMNEHRRMVILDARATSDWSAGHVAGALPFPFYNVEDMANRLPRDGTWILAYCACPHAESGRVVDELRRRHFTHTAIIDEGIGYWMAHGYPTARAAILSGSAPAMQNPLVHNAPAWGK